MTGNLLAYDISMRIKYSLLALVGMIALSSTFIYVSFYSSRSRAESLAVVGGTLSIRQKKVQPNSAGLLRLDAMINISTPLVETSITLIYPKDLYQPVTENNFISKKCSQKAAFPTSVPAVIDPEKGTVSIMKKSDVAVLPGTYCFGTFTFRLLNPELSTTSGSTDGTKFIIDVSNQGSYGSNSSGQRVLFTAPLQVAQSIVDPVPCIPLMAPLSPLSGECDEATEPQQVQSAAEYHTQEGEDL